MAADQNAKAWWLSRTIWFNVAIGMVGIGSELMIVADYLPQDWQAPARLGLSLLTAAGNVILRGLTRQPVTRGAA